MKGRSRVNIVGVGRILLERIRASLARSPFYFLDSPSPLPWDDVDLYVVPAGLAVDLLGSGTQTTPVPVLAYGPAALMRSAFLAGAADYLREPWGPEELGLRLMSVAQRTARSFVFPWGRLAMDGSILSTSGADIQLTFHESIILRALLLGRGSPVPRQALAYRLWGRPGPGASRAVDVHVAAIRRKLAAVEPAAGRFILCVRGKGYMVP